ncbi:MAG: AAA family ATPase [Bacteroidales bacterium]|nr:AAA family ATPase [Candidatus Latescibacterota bacterium]
MNIDFVEIQNFRKLKSCRVEIASQETILVGANNSGKTSAIDSMSLFLKKHRRNNIATTDFTLSNWSQINQIGTHWVSADDDTLPDLTLAQWLPYLPSIDIWLNAADADIHHVIHLLPTLDWTPKQKLGVRLVFAPINIEKLYKDFRDAYQAARDTEPSDSSKGKRRLSLWPGSMRNFLDRTLREQFEVKAYILDPAKCCDPEKGVARPQPLPADSEPMDRDPFDGLFKIDVITAQRGFSDPTTEDESRGTFASLSTQLRQYFTKHLNPSDSPDASDIEALEAIEEAKAIFDEKLRTSFKPAIGELEGLNYPGFSDPRISLTSELRAVDTLDHKAAVQFDVLPEGVDTAALSLPEQYNGLGYQNLISMVFSLIRFRDEWMRVGKAARKQSGDETIIEPLHIVLIEEPEAHLHAQVQQVFIKRAYAVLRNHAKLAGPQLNTQMIVSTHSSHIAHELDFTCLRYFRRKPAAQKGEIPSATVVNLSKTFGSTSETSKFATRYIKSTHCDLFFADAAILVEGSAERMLVPHFIKNGFKKLDQSYISLLEIGGSHAHRLKPLLATLGLLSLVITDLDSIGETGTAKIFPERGKKYRTGNATLKKWLPKKQSLDEILDCSNDDKQSDNEQIRVAYQCPIMLKYKYDSTEEETIPYTFEDSLALTNLELFRGYSAPTGLLKKLAEALDKPTLPEAANEMFNSLGAGSKAGMALELLYLTEPSELKPPAYIAEGLEWLEVKLAERKQDFLASATTEAKNA